MGTAEKINTRYEGRHFLLLLAGRYSAPLRRRGMSGLLSLMSISGLALAVSVLIIVSSVMNGFERELQQRMLSLLPQLQILPITNQQMYWPTKNTQHLIDSLIIQQDINAVDPYLEATVMVSRADRLYSVTLTAIENLDSGTLEMLPKHIVEGSLAQPQPYAVVIGSLLARQLDVSVGEQITLTSTDISITPLGPLTRQKRFHIVAIFEVGAELDLQQVFVPLSAGQKLLGRAGQVDGLRLSVNNPYRVGEIGEHALQAISFTPGLALKKVSWKESNRSLFRAVAMEKTMIFLLLLVVVAVASFNIVAIVLMTVNDKRSDIAVLRTLGATARQIRQLFIAQGLMIGISGSLIGTLLGLSIAPNVGVILQTIEQIFGWQLFDPTVYFIPFLPSQLQWSNIATISASAITISLLVSVYPAARAAKISPAEALSFEC